MNKTINFVTKRMPIWFIKSIIGAVIVFSTISFFSLAFETLSITSSFRENENILNFGFPFKIFEQFWVGSCDNLIRMWFPENIIKNFFIFFMLFFTILITFDKVKTKKGSRKNS